MPSKPSAVNILSAATTTISGSAHQPWGGKRVFQAYGTTSAGSGSATIKIEASLDGVGWVELDSLSLTLATTRATGVEDSSENGFPWLNIRARVSAITGTDASVNVWMGTEGY